MRFERVVWLVVLAVLAGPASAQWREWDAQYDDERKTWQEIQAQIPSYPKPENLTRIYTGTATLHQFFVDTTSISLGEDGVMRYTIVAKTEGGATDVTFEGMRCETRERKLYAIGRSDKTWVRPRASQWQHVLLRDLTPHHYTLYHDYFCPERTRPTAVRLAIDALKRGQSLNSSTYSD